MAATGTPMPYVKIQWFTNSGVPAASHLLFTYAAGTTTKLATYTDVDLSVANANPIVLDSAGRAVVFLSAASYKFVLAPSTDTDPPTSPIWTADNISSVPGFNVNLDVTGLAGEALTANDIVYLSAGSGGLTAGSWYKADSDNTYSSTIATQLGVVVSDIASAANGAIRVGGRVTGHSRALLRRTSGRWAQPIPPRRWCSLRSRVRTSWWVHCRRRLARFRRCRERR